MQERAESCAAHQATRNTPTVRTGERLHAEKYTVIMKIA